MRAAKSLIGLWLAAFSMSVLAQARELPDFTTLVEQQGNAVVNISTTQAVRRAALPQVPGMDDDEVMEFFRRFVPRQPPGQGPQGPQGPGRESRSLGSGFILSNDGYIMTNAHVVEGADEINVKLTDKREFKAKVIGADKRTDVALIKIDGTGSLPVVKFGDPNKLKVGEWVVAIGAPFGFENTVTAGIVSAKGRSLPQENFVPFIQTDVAINPGNSGGPLFNMRGEVVGVNTAIVSTAQGIGFAVPINMVKDLLPNLLENGRLSRGWLGIVVQEESPAAGEKGAVVQTVFKASPAARAGLSPGDRVTAVNGRPVEGYLRFMRRVAILAPGTVVRITVQRGGGGKPQELSVTLGERPAPGAASSWLGTGQERSRAA